MGPAFASGMRGAWLFLLLGCSASATLAQQAPTAPPPERQPAPRTQEEFAAYQKFIQEKNPDEQIRLLEDFLLEFPDTELKEYAFQAATQAYQAKNDYPKVLTYGEMTLAENEDNLAALLILASAIAERTGKSDIDKEEKLAEAEQYARRGLEVLAKLPKPPKLTALQWEQTRQDAEVAPHGALGLIAMIREDFPQAEFEFKMATEKALQPDAVTLYRLGLCYSFQKKYDLALETLQRSAESGGVKIPAADGTTRDLVAEAQEFARKAKAASETPVSGMGSSPSSVAP